MPLYEYENAAGERREILASMKEPPPEVVTIGPDGSWYPCGERDIMDARCGPFRRVYGAGLQPPIVKQYGVNYAGQKLPVSRALPLDLTPGTVENRYGHTVLKHADGGYTDLKGRRIINSKADVERAEASTGQKRD